MTSNNIKNDTNNNNNNNEKEEERLVFRVRYYNSKKNKFNDWENIYRVPKNNNDNKVSLFQYNFKLGGYIQICTNAISKQLRNNISNELLNNNNDDDNPLFRIYPIQGGNKEPRMNCMFHYNATINEFNTNQQPGYKYGSSITMKSHPIQNFTNLYNLANDMEYNIKKNIKDMNNIQLMSSNTNDKIITDNISVTTTTDTSTTVTTTTETTNTTSTTTNTTTTANTTTNYGTATCNNNYYTTTTSCNNNNNNNNNNETFWNVGVTAVLYRDGRDKMGYHADNDQGETIIATAIIESPTTTTFTNEKTTTATTTTTRKVSIKPTHTKAIKKKKRTNIHKHKQDDNNNDNVNNNNNNNNKRMKKRKPYCNYRDGDEEIEIYVQAGDYYVMDGEMQKHYLHAVPPHAASVVCCDDGNNNITKIKKTEKRHSSSSNDNIHDDRTISETIEAVDDDYSSTFVTKKTENKTGDNIDMTNVANNSDTRKTENNNNNNMSICDGGNATIKIEDNMNNDYVNCHHDSTTIMTIKTGENYKTDGNSCEIMKTRDHDDNMSDCDGGGSETIKIDDNNNNNVRDGSSSTTIKTKDNDDKNVAVKDDNNNNNNNINNNSNENQQQQQQRRLVLVFRRGNMVMYDKDSGIPCNDIKPRPMIKRQFGHIKDVDEGSVYDRTYITNMNAHRGFQRGISGNKYEGCDAIVVSGLREDQLGWDEFDFLCYAAHNKVGAKSLLQSAHLQKPIRVFRSGVLQNPFRAIMKKRYRYDGLYTIYLVHCIDEYTQVESVIEKDEYEKYRDMVTDHVYLFLLCRNPCGYDQYDNRYQSIEYIDRCIENSTMIPGARTCFNDMIINRPLSSPFDEFLFLLMLQHSPINLMDDIQNSVPESNHPAAAVATNTNDDAIILADSNSEEDPSVLHSPLVQEQQQQNWADLTADHLAGGQQHEWTYPETLNQYFDWHDFHDSSICHEQMFSINNNMNTLEDQVCAENDWPLVENEKKKNNNRMIANNHNYCHHQEHQIRTDRPKHLPPEAEEPKPKKPKFSNSINTNRSRKNYAAAATTTATTLVVPSPGVLQQAPSPEKVRHTTTPSFNFVAEQRRQQQYQVQNFLPMGCYSNQNIKTRYG